MKSKSLKINTILYMIKMLLGVIFPLITFPYASRILSPEGMGKVTFANSIVSYFVLVAALGISSYAIREGAKYREEPEKFQKFANEMFSICILSTSIACLAFLVMLFSVEEFIPYRGVLLILGLAIPLSLFSVEWVFSIFEDYLYITIRSLGIQLASLALLFFMVRTSQDVYEYAVFYVSSTVASNIFNFIRARKYCRFKVTLKRTLKKHLRPILIIFASSVATTIYLSTDTTLLGIMGSDEIVGYYSTSSKIYTIVQTMMNALVTVTFARLSFYKGVKNFEAFDKLFQKLMNIIFILIIPITGGIFMLGDEIVVLVSGEEYLAAGMSLRILALALPFTVLGSLFSTVIFLPFGHEKEVMIATIIGASVNFGLNLFIIPQYFQNGAAFTTLLSEILVLSVHIFNLRKFYTVRNYGKCMWQGLIGLLPILLICKYTCDNLQNNLLLLVCAISGSAVSYFGVLWLLKNEIVMEYIDLVKGKWKLFLRLH